MSVRILVQDTADEPACTLYDSVTMWAFGPVVTGPDCVDRMERFVSQLPDDPRIFPAHRLDMLWSVFIAGEEVAEREAAEPEADTEDDSSRRIVQAFVDEARRFGASDEDIHDALENVDWENVTNGALLAQTWYSPDVPVAVTSPPAPDISPEPPPAPHDTDDDATVPAGVGHAVADRPVASRDCWNCQGTGQEPGEYDRTVCGICDGRGWLPT